MKTFVAAVFLVIAGASFANAMPLAPTGPAANGDVIQIAGGCGPGFHRGPYGGCRPNRGPVIVAPRRVIVERPIVVGRRCPPGMFWRHGRCR